MKSIRFLLMLMSILLLQNLDAQEIDRVINRVPETGSVMVGDEFMVYVQVFEEGVTETSGEGSGIDCEIYYGRVNDFGETWKSTGSAPMIYNRDVGDNDEYVGTISLNSGLYEYKCRCTKDDGKSWSYDNGGHGQLTVSILLPVKLLSLNAVENKNQVTIVWSTEFEINNSHFMVEKSSNSKNWSLLERVEGRGTTNSPKTYDVTDVEPFSGENYYRIKQVEVDGSIRLSDVVDVNFELLDNSVFPNPFYSTITLKSQTENTLLKIFNTDGQIITSEYLRDSGHNIIDLSLLSTGMYAIILLDSSGKLLMQDMIYKQ